MEGGGVITMALTGTSIQHIYGGGGIITMALTGTSIQHIYGGGRGHNHGTDRDVNSTYLWRGEGS